MAKESKALLLPSKVRNNLKTMGIQIKMARKRRKLSLAATAERAQCSQLTLIRVEKGEPTVSIGIYARVLYALGLDNDLTLLAKADPAGNAIVNNEVMKRYEKDIDDYDVFD
jgi:transcriptional regulator with XRE-family HTH domain